MNHRRWSCGLACALALVTVAPSRVHAQSAAAGAPMVAPAAQPVVVELPFRGSASPDLLQIAEDATRSALQARGAVVADRDTVRSAAASTPPTDTASIVAFGRSMSATYVLVGSVTPLAGQYNLELRLYEVATSRVATQSRNLGDGEESTVIPGMLTALWEPDALQLSPEDQARIEAERRAREEAARRDREAAEQRARDEAAARARAEAERQQRLANRHVYTLGEGGPWSLGAGVAFGGRFSPVDRPAGAPQPDVLAAALRLEGLYAVLPRYGLELGLSAQLIFSPTSAFGIGATGRFWFPWRAYVPIRAGVGVTAGLFQSVTGARATSAWLSFDARGEYDITKNFTVWAALILDSIPGQYGSLAGAAGIRVHFGASAPAASTSTGTGNNQGGSSSSSPSQTLDQTPIVAN